MTHYYLDRDNNPSGPITLEQIAALATSGEIDPEPMVVPVGGSEWKPLTELITPRSAGSEVSQPIFVPGVPVAGTFLADLVRFVLKHVARILNPKFVDRSISISIFVGHFAVLAGAVLGLIYALFAAIKLNSFGVFAIGLGFVCCMAFAQFAASNFLGAANKLIANSPSRISSTAFLECVGLLTVLGAVGAFLAGIYASIQEENAAALIPALLLTVLFLFLGAVALHPETAGIKRGSGSAGEDAIGLLSFGLKSLLRIVPLFFCLFAVIGALGTAAAFFKGSQSLMYQLRSFLPMGIPSQALGLSGSGLIIVACLLPMVAYFGFLVQYLLLDVIRAVLAVPSKLDALRR